uniref:Uncharacterized protein n=1 Tax=Timema poppense TaxID=170557 RepID=A0A7R9DEZ8_TIMPO|nr:unnamed protein product [Timema poppensis]
MSVCVAARSSATLLLDLTDNIDDYVYFNPEGYFITSINGLSEDPGNDLFWYIYDMDKAPDTSNPPTKAYLSKNVWIAVRFLFSWKQKLCQGECGLIRCREQHCFDLAGNRICVKGSVFLFGIESSTVLIWLETEAVSREEVFKYLPRYRYNHLRTVYHRFLRLILAMSGLPSLDSRIRGLAEKFFTRARASSNMIVRGIGDYDPPGRPYRRIKDGVVNPFVDVGR